MSVPMSLSAYNPNETSYLLFSLQLKAELKKKMEKEVNKSFKTKVSAGAYTHMLYRPAMCREELTYCSTAVAQKLASEKKKAETAKAEKAVVIKKKVLKSELKKKRIAEKKAEKKLEKVTMLTGYTCHTSNACTVGRNKTGIWLYY